MSDKRYYNVGDAGCHIPTYCPCLKHTSRDTNPNNFEESFTCLNTMEWYKILQIKINT